MTIQDPWIINKLKNISISFNAEKLGKTIATYGPNTSVTYSVQESKTTVDKTALITGVSGQDGSYLAELLLDKGFKVIGIARRASHNNTGRLSNVIGRDNFSLLTGDITDFSSMMQIISDVKPNWIFNLAAQSHVGTSFSHACTSLDVTAQGCVNILECVRLLKDKLPKDIRVYQASSSEMFGDSYNTRVNPDDYYADRYQDENTKLSPRSPYAVAKVAAHNYCRLYRNAYELDVRMGILFNHESPRRGDEFVTRKITKWIGQFKKWLNPMHEQGQWPPQDHDNRLYNSICDPEGFPKLRLGNLDASRDWGHAKDYVNAMYLIMNADKSDEWVVSTGETYTIKDFLKEAFEVAGLGDWTDYVVIDQNLMRPAEVPYLCGDSSKIRKELGWEPTYTFTDLVKEMVEHDIQ